MEVQKMKDLGISLGRIVSVAADNRIFFIPVTFLLGRTEMVAGILPFGFAFFAASANILPKRLFLVVAVLAGAATKGRPEQVYLNLGGILLFYFINKLFKSFGKENQPLAAFVSITIPVVALAVLNGFLMYDLIRSAFCILIVMVSYFIFRHTLSAFVLKKGRKVLTNEEIISTAITAGLVASGLVGQGESAAVIKDVICLVIIMYAGYRAGSGAGAAAGVVLGLAGSLSSDLVPITVGVFSFSGFISGVLKGKKKTVFVMGMLGANAILALYLNEIASPYEYLKEVAIASVIFFLVPKKQIAALESLFIGGDEFKESRYINNRVRNIAVTRLEKFSQAFDELAATFNEINDAFASPDQREISAMFDKVADRVCRDCSLCRHCWDRNFINTYQAMFKIVENLDKKGYVDADDIPEYFLERCERIGAFVEVVNFSYEMFKIDLVWKGRISESRSLIASQYKCLADAVYSLANEIKSKISYMEEVEDKIFGALVNKGVNVKEVKAVENNFGRYEIEILHAGCGGSKNCLGIIEKTVSEAAGRRMYSDNTTCGKIIDGCCLLKMHECDNFRVTVGIAGARRKGSEVSGDSFSFLNTDTGKYIVALSDGMGSGYQAANQSKATISLLENLIESGFTKDMAVNLINSVLVLKCGDETYSTIDISIIDLFSGDVEFVKTGAPPTYVKKADDVEIVKAASLPAGILGNIETELMHKTVEDGDIIIMTTDGIVDSFASENNGEKELAGFIRGITSANPQEFADIILKEAETRCGGQPEDDMTVVVAKIWC